MKMRKLFAGIAAAATLLGGMALGAASAQADGSGTVVKSDVNFTFTAQDAKQLTNRSLNAYKIADYVQYGTDDNATYGVQTADGVDRGTLKTALESATGKTVSETGDLMAWALAEGVLSVDNSVDGAWNNSASRKFVESLKTRTNMLGDPTVVDLGKNLAKDGLSATVTLPAGLYLFVDADYSVGTNGVATPSIAILVGSGNVKDGVLNPLTEATVAIKNQTTAVTKKVNGEDVITASVGQKVTYTITSKVPQNTQYYSEYGYTYTDTPSAGQTVDFDSLKVTVGDKSLNKGTDYTVAQNKNGTFTVTISSIQKQTAGALITVTYAAKVTEAGASGSKAVTNAVVLSDNGAEAIDSTIITNSGFSFTKTDAQGNPLAGATFTIRVPGVDGSFTATSDKTGTVTFKGLADGTYEVNETTVPNGFQQSLKAKFNVIIENGEVKFRGTDVWGLAPKESSDKYKVKNVKNVTQLPLTGAAGTTLFTVVALLVAGAGVTVALKSRQRVR
ncbi:isopeptide-forming domain-containing fimbrial protein [Bifidobacterium pseudocatenulatum]|jgi:fimbrial isopeptide formation D2 family protein/LPXTG-motif cell wall-anchored protein|uniref:isopeptide-forming domain-containing fimbrial protein n=1 Tax=Bifidobacterium pseudocatenulatum TaxID=28026 RepID=UPI001CFD5187|nr:isopeptide-forming domain-containing fimbrial protein [Bifidobacterium pseudocatenulatum]MCB4911683.1 isopeptide-forming domain-containing fimbrial protein [Bifidobacterium pseudocatenulatum]UDG88359.1 isopeptide-forming domain-containing fimbrial protein [Bifidobacterium pseudocatenulatum]